MFRFFKVRKWLLWAWAGLCNLSSLWIQVQIDVKINEWFGQFYDMIQKALGKPNAVTIEEYWRSLLIYIFSWNLCSCGCCCKRLEITLFVSMANSNGRVVSQRL